MQPIPMEIKAGQTVSRDAFKGFANFSKLASSINAAFLFYGGEESCTRQSVHVTIWRDIFGIRL